MIGEIIDTTEFFKDNEIPQDVQDLLDDLAYERALLEGEELC